MNPPAPILHDFMNLWQVKKQITVDEALPTMVDLLLPKQQVEEHIIPHLSAQSRDILGSRRRTRKVDIPVYDDDIGEGFEGSTELELEKSGGEYFLANWTHVIMRRRAMRGRQIQAGDYLVGPGTGNFQGDEVNQVLKIPIGVKEVDDRSIGTSMELENIQFKPGYNVLRTLDEEQQATGGSNHPSTNKELWKSMWKLGVPPKTRNQIGLRR
ncbi:hypothetical protein NC653_035973 [Populus alba x Populus x berolinensis]|uniref:Uncharacterized protein n=2 Tax=Populus TaxID=3689 RepID=A0A4U5PLY4_POPAL|nr:hypothetical protein NC653_035973 [Populus alba x Populus x berolinensis]TKR97868.1 hypothetical protein D5086_0000208760 [Populus alba]